ncbi:TonB-dependent receptor plug domain-containing protein [Altererythrobacter aquaemixtae]|uniref:TonB-dependent receptor plug domain-containing protein n=2 Tax=Pontixanthobacter aquaemixtae TaxID=1958940 RepID=A0A844ZQY0_9SPHN|nr:TonB-dependent receptor plug domain-containing protein [Pontixanthobacter aquaemixtae]
MAGSAFCIAAPVAAQEEAGEETTGPTADQSGAIQTSSTEMRGQVYNPDFFEQFAPRNALDMVARIPGFTIDDGNRGQRGLGEANQNVIVNGERFSSKSESIRDQLQRIPAADVVRIEILDGTSLDIPGLTGQVANIVRNSSGTSGQFRWRTGFRAHNTEAQLFGGEISLTGTSGALGYTISLSNENNRFGADGPTLITAADGSLIEEQYSKFSGKFDNPKLATNFTYDFGGETTANLNLSYGSDFFMRNQPETGLPPGGPLRTRESTFEETGPEYEIGGDIEFPLGPGKLKLIGLERFERDNGESILIDRFDDNTQSTGFRFLQVNEAGERIGRLEYNWPMFGGDWQVSGEAAFNRLDRASRLFELDANEQFIELAFPEGTGGVTEDRFEAIASYSSQLSDTLSFQLSLGGEYSKIEQTGVAANSRSFQRPKGAASITWKPEDDFDISFEIRRRVGQLSFGDFLASVSLNDNNQNDGNNTLQPDQSWNFDVEINKGLGDWGSAKLQFRHARFEDFVDFFPLASGGEARGNIGNAERTQLELNTTLNGEPVGFDGARLEVRAIKRWMSVIDPFTGLDRPFSNDLNDLLDIDFRHDIPGSDWAWGGGLFTEDKAPFSRRFEVGRDYEGPTFARLFVEHKDVFGLTVNATYANVPGARNKFERTVFDGSRPNAPILFVERMNRRIGPIFRFSVSGSF